MALTLYLRDSAGEACGPGTRKDLSTVQGASPATMDLDATGDTWNIVSPFGLGGIRLRAPGDWKAYLVLKKTGLTNGTCNVKIQRRNSSCVLQETLLDEDITVTSTSFVLHTVTDSSSGNTPFYLGDLLLLILTETGGTVILEYDQAGLSTSRIDIPDPAAGPQWYYHMLRKRNEARKGMFG